MDENDTVTLVMLDSGQKVRALGDMEEIAKANNQARAVTGWQPLDDYTTSNVVWVRAERVVMLAPSEADDD